MNTFGTVTINGKTYLKRPREYSYLLSGVSSNGSYVNTGVRLVLPGVADFMLMYLKRDTLVAGVSTARRFLARFGNSDGNTWYQQGGLGGSTDRVIDTCLFGNGQFPYALQAPIIFGASANIMLEVQDISNQGGTYDIYFSFGGIDLLPNG